MADREQLVVSLGDGSEGRRLREVLDRAAERAGRPVSVWARETLLAAAGDPQSESPIDPIQEGIYHANGARSIFTFDLREIGAIQGGETIGGSGRVGVVVCLFGGTWWTIETEDPKDFIARWKRVRRWGNP